MRRLSMRLRTRLQNTVTNRDYVIHWSIATYRIALVVLLSVGAWPLSQPETVPQALRKLDSTAVDKTDHKFIRLSKKSDTTDTVETERLDHLEETLTGLVNEFIEKHQAHSIGVYFRSLEYGSWAGVHEDFEFSPESLLKVPVMMTYFKMAESESRILFEKIRYEGGVKSNTSEFFSPSRGLQAGKEYTVNDLIYRMIIYSDTDSHSLLYKHLDKNALYDLYRDFGIPDPQLLTSVNGLFSPRAYSSFLTALYDASYLSADSSEQALQLLSETEFCGGLVAGVPNNIRVAHKFGERSVLFLNGAILERQLHDCGIIYHPKGAYVLCVMTRGTDFRQLETTLAGISRVVYSQLTEHRNTH